MSALHGGGSPSPLQSRAMPADLMTVLLFAATAASGLLAGASLDQSIKQLPARRRIGAAAYSRYSRAADLGNGIAFYAILGISVLMLNVGAAIAGYIHGVSMSLALTLRSEERRVG